MKNVLVVVAEKLIPHGRVKETTLIGEEYLNGQIGIGQTKNGRWNDVRWVVIPIKGNGIWKDMGIFKCTVTHWDRKSLIVIMNGAPKEGRPRWIQRQAKAGYEYLQHYIICLDDLVFKVFRVVPYEHQWCLLLKDKIIKVLYNAFKNLIIIIMADI